MEASTRVSGTTNRALYCAGLHIAPRQTRLVEIWPECDAKLLYMKIYFRMMFLFAVVPLLMTVAASVPQTLQDQPLRAVPELIRTKYCYGDGEVFSVWLKLRVKYINQTEKTVILDKEIGKAWYREKVARTLEDLSAGKYEYNPNKDWFFSDKDKLPGKPNAQSPSPDFIVLSPGQMFVSEINTSVVAQYENPKDFAGSIRPGAHVFQMELAAWSHPGEASEFARSWKKFGDLVTGVVKTEPLEISIPSKPKVERNCK